LDYEQTERRKKKNFFEKSQDSGELFAFLVSRSSESETKP
jgi:hypothetical protein